MPVEGVEEFRRAAAALLGADREVLSEVGKSMRLTAKPIVTEIRSKVRSSKGESPRGSSASTVDRQLHALGKYRTSNKAHPLHDDATGHLSAKRVKSLQRRLDKVASLRDSIASASGASVSAGTTKIALAFKVRASNLPPSQRKLPRRWDSPTGWSHPVFGNRKNWVKQRGNPYFTSTIFPRRGDVEKGVVDAMSIAAEKILHPDEGEI